MTTLEEEEYPHYYNRTVASEEDQDTQQEATDTEVPIATPSEESVLKQGHLTVKENQRGVSYETLFGKYLIGAQKLTITDAYLRKYYQIRNLMELIEVIIKNKAKDDEITIDLITVKDDFKDLQQEEFFETIQNSCEIAGIHFNYSFDENNIIHARHIVTDTGWKISLDRGLDIFQHYEMNDTFSLQNHIQEYRQCKAFEVTFIKL